MERPTILFLHSNVRRINYRGASHHWLAHEVGFRALAVNWRAVRVTKDGTFVRGGYEAVSESERRWLQGEERVEPDVIVHRHLVRARSASVLRRLARAHPQARISYCRSWKSLSWKWTAELCFRAGETDGIAVTRPRTFLITRNEVEKRLSDAGAGGPLIFKPSTAARCLGIWISTPETFPEIARRVRRSSWRHFVVQDLLVRPVLYEGRKFDLRLFAMLTSVEPMRFRLYRGGVVRLAAHPFDPARHGDGLRTLTGASYRKRRRASTRNLSLDELRVYLAERGYNMAAFDERAERLLEGVFRAMTRHPYAKMVAGLNRFYLTGLDVLMVDTGGDYELQFLETNYCPQLNAWGRRVDDSLRNVHVEWLRDLYQLCPR